MLAVGLEGADREQLRRVVTAEDPRFVFPRRGALQELEGELTDDLCTIISTRVRGWAASWGSSPHGGGVVLGFSLPGLMRPPLVSPAGAGAKALRRAVPQGERPRARGGLSGHRGLLVLPTRGAGRGVQPLTPLLCPLAGR